MPTLVLAEVRDLQATLLQQRLGERFEILRARSEAEALRLLRKHDAVALVAGLRQSDTRGGLRLAQKARQAHPDLVTVVYGGRDAGPLEGRGRDLEQLYRLDAYVDWPRSGRCLGRRLCDSLDAAVPAEVAAA